MGCGCKKTIETNTEGTTDTKFSDGLAVRIIMYLFILAITPFIMVVVAVILFNKFFISGEINLVKTGLSLHKLFSKKKKEDEDFTEEEEGEDYDVHNIYTVEKVV